MPSSTKIVIATPDSDWRSTLLDALHSEPSFNVVGQASDCARLLALRRQLQPDILLLDCALANLVNGDVSSWPRVRIILLAAVIDQENVMQALRLAARGIVPTTASRGVLLASIRSVMADQYWLGTDSIAILVQMLRDLLPEYDLESSPARHGLTAREQDIIAMIVAGHANKQIAQKLSISERTVKHYLTGIFGKLGLSSRLQLAAFAVTYRLAPNASPVRVASTLRSDTSGREHRKVRSAVSVIGS